jgi:hypothetical protein
LKGEVVKVNLTLGHNNDQGVFNRTKIAEYCQTEKIKLLADGGYSSHHLICPDSKKSSTWNFQQRSKRTVVEHLFSIHHGFAAATTKFVHNPELQEVALICIWYIVARYTKEFPLR